MYFFEKFLSKKLADGYLFNVRYFQAEKNKFFRKNDRKFEFYNNGRSIRLYGGGDPAGEVARLVEIKRDSKTQRIICDPRTSPRLKKKTIRPTVAVAGTFLGGYGDLCYLRTYPMDVFKASLEREKKQGKSKRRPGILYHLQYNDYCQYLVYNVTKPQLTDLIHRATHH